MFKPLNYLKWYHKDHLKEKEIKKDTSDDILEVSVASNFAENANNIYFNRRKAVDKNG